MTQLPPKCVLATDLDGTLIPLHDNEQNQRDLITLEVELRANRVELIFVTGRHFKSVQQVMEECPLPVPEWIICDVGTTILRRRSHERFTLVSDYANDLQEIVAGMPRQSLARALECVVDLRIQEPEKQGAFKLSYYVNADCLEGAVQAIQDILAQHGAPWSVIFSVDPFNGDGLLDLLPAGVSKAHAIAWWTRHIGRTTADIVFAGDSGNDFDALRDYRSIIVGNADRSLIDRVSAAKAAARPSEPHYVADGHATSGVLEGCRALGLTISDT